MQINFIQCQSCGNNVHPLEVFPGDKCLPCHGSKVMTVTHLLTVDDLAKMFGGK